MTWTVRAMGRLPDSDPNPCTCKLVPVPHIAVYRAESVNDETGEVRTGYLCTNRAAAVAQEHGIAFPPGRWVEAEPKRTGKVFKIPPGTPMATCRSCHANVRWIVTDTGKRMPVDLDGISHFATCVNANQHRKPR